MCEKKSGPTSFFTTSQQAGKKRGPNNCYICPMRKKLVLFLAGIFCWLQAGAQTSYLNRPDLLERVEVCLHHTYNFSFEEAREIQLALLKATPLHPAPVFLEALIVYWEHFPLLPSDDASAQFITLMEQVTTLANELSEQENTHIEGVFFDLFGRAFQAMFWADNGKSGKVVPDLRAMYRHTKEGFDLKDDFVEFYFSTGLYNYYIEAYPEAHAIYKPLLAFMQKGDKELGIQQLNHAIGHSVFLKVESILFMSLIQLNYEEDLKTAALYAERLVRDYPRNIYYQGHLINILLYLERYSRVDELISDMDQDDNYSMMIRALSTAFMAERKRGSELQAEKAYLEALERAGAYGAFTNTYKAIAHMGLSRLYQKKGNQSESKSHGRKARHLTSYGFILDEHSPGSR